MELDLSRLFEELIKEEYKNKKNLGYLSQMAVIVTKSLVPSFEDVSVNINYDRYIKELDLWTYYKVDSNLVLSNIKKLEEEKYWAEPDDSIISRVIPIIIVNKEEDILISEIIKNILFTTGNIEELFKYISISYLIYLIINNIGNKTEKLKEKIINFSQKDFLKNYNRYYRTDKNTYKGNYTVDFEKEKIDILSFINGIEFEKYKEIKDIFNIIDKKNPETSVGNILYNFLYNKDYIDIPIFYKDMGDYLLNLRKSKISPDILKIEEYILPNIFEYNVGDKFYHTLLSQCKVLKKEIKNNIIYSLIDTKSGIYLFKKRI